MEESVNLKTGYLKINSQKRKEINKASLQDLWDSIKIETLVLKNEEKMKEYSMF